MQKIYTLLLLFLTFCSFLAQPDPVQQTLAATPQNAVTILLHEKIWYDIKLKEEKKLKEKYLSYYFFPWSHTLKFRTLTSIYNDEQNYLRDLSINPGWSENQMIHPQHWLKNIADNMNLEHFPNNLRNAITINPTDLRVIPTLAPSFGNPKKAGQGYPFDNLQASLLPANLPIKILQTTKDRAWNLVITPDDSLGWIQSENIAYTNSSFTQTWMHLHNWITPIKENIPIQDNHAEYYFSTRLGDIYPFIKNNTLNSEIYVVTRDSNQMAVVKQAFIPKNDAIFWPARATGNNIAIMANAMLGTPYGWGSIYGDRDCSSTTENLFEHFGIWLPRTSTQQSTVGKFISLAHLSEKIKSQIIIQKGIPFFTLLWLPGHIVLYIGTENKNIYIFHSPWGVHTKSLIWRTAGRDLIGRTVITPIDLGKNDWYVPKTWLDEIQGMVILVPKNLLQKNWH